MTRTEAKPADDFYLRVTQSEWRAMKLKLALFPEMVEALDDAQGMLLLQGVAYDHPDIKRISAILAKARQHG